jgi:hypothetical protein
MQEIRSPDAPGHPGPSPQAVAAEYSGGHRPARYAVEVTDFGRPGENRRYLVEAVAYRRP